MGYFIDLSLLRRNRNFRVLYLGQSVSFLGTMITSVALPYQIYHETHSVLMVGLLSLLELIPLLFTALLGGVLADRSHRKILLLVTEFWLALGSLVLAYNASLSTPHVWVIFVTAIFMSAINGLHRPALDSIVQQLVNKKDFSAVGSLSSLKFSTGMIVGPAMGGLLIAHFGLKFTYIIDFFSFLFSWISIFLIKNITKTARSTDQSALSSLVQGFRYALSRQELLGTYFVDFIAMVFGMPMALFPAIAHAYGGAKTLGLLYSAPAVGALLVSFLSGWTKNIQRQGLAILTVAGLWGLAIMLFGFSNNIWLALFFLSLAGAFDAISGIFRQTMWNETIPNEYRGRLAGIEMIGYTSGPLLGNAEAGFVAAAFGITGSIVSGGILCMLGVVICACYLPKFLQYKSESSESNES